MEEGNEILDRLEADVLYALERAVPEFEYYETRYEEVETNCGPPTRSMIGLYGPEREELQRLQQLERQARAQCDRLQNKARRVLNTDPNSASSISEEFRRGINRLRGQLAQMNEEAVGILLDNAESDKEATEALLAALGADTTRFRATTREEIDANIAKTRAEFDETIAELKEAQAATSAARTNFQESPQIRVGSGGSSLMPPQQRYSIEMSGRCEWKP